MSGEPIFIVGVQRSGTTLLAAMLAAHSRLSCGPETHFFRRLAEVDASLLCDPVDWPRPALDFVTAISHTGFTSTERTPLLAKYQIGPGEVAASLQRQRPSIAALLASVTEPYMSARKKVRWVEKTPDHLLHTDAIRQHFPRSPIIRIVRDPRDVALSLQKVPWGVSSFVEGLAYWERMDRLSRGFFDTDCVAVTIRFEDLIEDPRTTLGSICEFIGEPFELGMLDTSGSGAEINSRHVPWKDKVKQAPDSSRVGVWRSEIERRDNQIAEALVGDRLEAYRYPRQEDLPRFGDLRPGVESASKYPAALGLLAAGGVRFWRANPAEKPAATIYLGDPDSETWQPLAADIVRARLFRKRVHWVPGSDDERWRGYRSYVLRKGLWPFRLRLEPQASERPDQKQATSVAVRDGTSTH